MANIIIPILSNSKNLIPNNRCITTNKVIKFIIRQKETDKIPPKMGISIDFIFN